MFRMMIHLARNFQNPGRAHCARHCAGFSVLEMLIVVLILGIVASLGIDAVSAFEANHRAERAARYSWRRSAIRVTWR